MVLKRVFALLFACGVLVGSLSGCGRKPSPDAWRKLANKTQSSSSSTVSSSSSHLESTPSPTPTASPTPTPTPTPTPVPTPNLLGSGSCGDNLTWKLEENGLLTISGTGEMYDFDFHWDYDMVDSMDDVIKKESPWKYTVWRATEDGKDISNVKRVVIEEGATSIGAGAFFALKRLESVSLPGTLTKIGEQAFGCSGLPQITIPASVTSIASNAFIQAGVNNGENWEPVKINFDGSWTQWRNATGFEPDDNVFVAEYDRPSKLTEEEASAVAKKYFNITDDSSLKLATMEGTEKEGVEYYGFAVYGVVDGGTAFSQLDRIYVNAETGECIEWFDFE